MIAYGRETELRLSEGPSWTPSGQWRITRVTKGGNLGLGNLNCSFDLALLNHTLAHVAVNLKAPGLINAILHRPLATEARVSCGFSLATGEADHV
jgi:hypothetical protein